MEMQTNNTETQGRKISTTQIKLRNEGDRSPVGALKAFAEKEFIGDKGEIETMLVGKFEGPEGKWDCALSAGLKGALTSADVAVFPKDGAPQVLDTKTLIYFVRGADTKNKDGKPLSTYDVFAV